MAIDRLRDVDCVGSKMEGLPLTKQLAVNTLLTRLRSEWYGRCEWMSFC